MIGNYNEDKIKAFKEMKKKMVELDHMADYRYPEKWYEIHDFIDKRLKELGDER